MQSDESQRLAVSPCCFVKESTIRPGCCDVEVMGYDRPRLAFCCHSLVRLSKNPANGLDLTRGCKVDNEQTRGSRFFNSSKPNPLTILEPRHVTQSPLHRTFRIARSRSADDRMRPDRIRLIDADTNRRTR